MRFSVFCSGVLLFGILSSGCVNYSDEKLKEVLSEAGKLSEEQRYRDAEDLLKKYVESGNPEIQFQLAEVLYKDDRSEQSVKFYRLAAEQDHIEALKTIADLVCNCEIEEEDCEPCLQLLLAYVEKNGDREICKKVAAILEDLGKMDEAVVYLKKVADPDGEYAGDVEYQIMLGKYYKEKGIYSKAYHYFELAAEQKNVEAWLELGKLYYFGYGLRYSHRTLGKIYYEAVENSTNTGWGAYELGVAAMFEGNHKDLLYWMQLSAKRGYWRGIAFWEGPQVKEYIEKYQDPKNNDPHEKLHPANRSFIDSVNRLYGKGSDRVEEILYGWKINDESRAMITVDIPENELCKRWSYDRGTVETLINKNVVEDRQGQFRWMSEFFHTMPLERELFSEDETYRKIDEAYFSSFEKFLKKIPLELCKKEFTEKTVQKALGDILEKESEFNMWKLDTDLYLCIETTGVSENHIYMFISTAGEKPQLLFSQSYLPPDAKDIAIACGMMKNDPAALNNLVVKVEYGEACILNADDADDVDSNAKVKAILEKLVDKQNAVAAYNLAVFHQNRNDDINAVKYFNLAEKLAGSSVISIYAQRPEIFDRNGKLLIKNKLYLEDKEHSRLPVCGGRFAASFIGFVSNAGRWTEYGTMGIEQLIDKNDVTHPVYTTIDYTVQEKLTGLIEKIADEADPLYAYGIVINSAGEMVAAAQSSVYDLEKREYTTRSRNENWNGWGFIPATFYLPIPDAWMKLLGSSSYALPESKRKFRFHCPTGRFSGETQGIVLGINRMEGVSDPKVVSGQTATLINYLLAYIGVAEKRDTLLLSELYSDKVYPPVSMQENVRWISFYRPPDGIIVNALGKIKTADGQDDLYVAIRVVPMEREFGVKVPDATIKFAAMRADVAEKIIRDYDFLGKEK